MIGREWTIEGEPVGKGRPRAVVQGKRVRFYTPAKTAAWESRAAAMFKASPQGDVIEGAVNVYVTAVFARPQRLRQGDRQVNPTSRCDIDNVVKAALDALTMSKAVFVDDKQVTMIVGRKYYAGSSESAHVVVTVEAGGATCST